MVHSLKSESIINTVIKRNLIFDNMTETRCRNSTCAKGSACKNFKKSITRYGTAPGEEILKRNSKVEA